MPISRFTLAYIALSQNLVSAFHHHHHHRRAVHSWIKKPSFDSRCTTNLFSLVNIAEDAPRDLNAMDQWAYECGSQRVGSLQFTAENTLGTNDGNKMDISFMTTEDIPTSTSILYVPNEMILSSNKAIEEFGHLQNAEDHIASKNAQSETRQYYLMLKILAEWEKGDQSPWYPWLNALPRFYSNAVSMTHLCYTCLPALMSIYAMRERTNMNNLLFKDVPFLSAETKSNFDVWIWAYQVVYTRSFEADDGSGDLRIVPVGDYFNHGTHTNIAMGYDEGGNYHVQTTADVPAGSQLLTSYGCPTNPSYLFARYGFLDYSSPATFCKAVISNPSEEVINLGYSFNRMLFYKESGEASQEVWDVMLYKYLEKLDTDLRREFYDAHMAGDYDSKQAFHEKYYPELVRKLMFQVDSFIQILDDLSEKTHALDLDEHPRAPLILRHNEFVRETFLAVKNRYYVEVVPVEEESEAEVENAVV